MKVLRIFFVILIAIPYLIKCLIEGFVDDDGKPKGELDKDEK